MNFALDDEQELIVSTVRRFADRDLRSWAADADRAGAPPDKLTQVAGDLGFFLDAVPADADGLLDGPYSHLVRALRGFELGRGCAAMAALIECNVEPALATARWGSAAAKQALYASLASGGLATTGRDFRGTLAIEKDGGGVRISGTIGPLPALGVASHVLLVARELVALVPVPEVGTDEAGGRRSASSSDTKREAIAPNGWRAARWGKLICDNHAVAADFVLATGATAADAGSEILAWYRASLAARAAGVAAIAMEHAEKYAAERVQFGQPIGSFEALLRMRDDALTSTAAARLLALYAAWSIDRGKDATGRAVAADAASRARVFACDVVGRATIDAVQIFGGYGFVNDFPVEKLMRDARAFDALLGDERFDRVLAEKARRQ